MITFSNPRIEATFTDWPLGGSKRGACKFWVEWDKKRGYRFGRQTSGKPKFMTYGGQACIVEGSDGLLYAPWSPSVGLTRGPAGWQATQEALPGMDADDIEMTGCFDVKGLNVKSDSIGIGLTFSIKDVDVSTLAKFANRDGRIVIESIEEIPEGEGDEFNAED